MTWTARRAVLAGLLVGVACAALATGVAALLGWPL